MARRSGVDARRAEPAGAAAVPASRDRRLGRRESHASGRRGQARGQGRRARKKHRTGQMADRVADVEVYLDAVRRPLKYRRTPVRRPREHARRGTRLLQTLTTGNDARRPVGERPRTVDDRERGPRLLFQDRRLGAAVHPHDAGSYDAAAKRQYRLDIFMHGRDDTVLEQQFMAKSTTGYASKPLGAGRRSVHAAAVRPLHQREPVRGRDRRPRSDRVRRQGLSHRSQPHRHDRLLDGRRLRVVLHRALRRSVGRRGARRGVHRNRGVPARRPRAAAAERRAADAVAPVRLDRLRASTRSTCRSSRTRARSTGRNRRPTRWPPRCSSEGLTLEHIIGPNTGHSYEPGARQQLQDRLDQLAADGRNPAPKEIRFTTWTLRYNKMFWMTVDAMARALAARPGGRADRRRRDPR